MRVATPTNAGTAGTEGRIYFDYEAARKFRGDWVEVPARDGVTLNLDNDGECIATDPVKRAAVEACDRIMTSMAPGMDRGDPQSTREYRAAVELQSKLWGSVAPVKTEVSGPEGGPIQVSWADLMASALKEEA